MLLFNRLNVLPTRNLQAGTFAAADTRARVQRGPAVAISCAPAGGWEHIYAAKDGNGVRLEYESLFALGPLCGISDADAILEAARRCDHLGLDTISTGATIAFAMECAEKGLIDDPDLRFGNPAALLRFVEQIATREGLGDLLAEGTRRAAGVIGDEAPDFAPHVKGLEIPGYEPRTLQTMALGFAVGSRGADHNRSGAYEADFSAKVDRLHGSAESAHVAVETEDRAALIDSLILCKFLRGVFVELYGESADLLAGVTGWDVTGDELRRTAARIVSAKKLFNLREGWTPEEDTLPKRMLSQSLPAGLAAGATLPADRLQEMIAAYYRERNWHSDGQVPAAIINALGLRDLATSAKTTLATR